MEDEGILTEKVMGSASFPLAPVFQQGVFQTQIDVRDTSNYSIGSVSIRFEHQGPPICGPSAPPGQVYQPHNPQYPVRPVQYSVAHAPSQPHYSAQAPASNPPQPHYATDPYPSQPNYSAPAPSSIPPQQHYATAPYPSQPNYSAPAPSSIPPQQLNPNITTATTPYPSQPYSAAQGPASNHPYPPQSYNAPSSYIVPPPNPSNPASFTPLSAAI